MTELIITSSVLILAVVALRHVLKGRISLRLQYALWALVLLRLLAPVNLFASAWSVLNFTERLKAQPAVQTIADIGKIHIPSQSFNSAYEAVVQKYEANGIDVSRLQGGDPGALDYEAYALMKGPSVGELVKSGLFHIWYAGIGVTGLCLLFSNLSFGRKLERTRKRYAAEGCKLPVYEAETLPSPCLFGLFRPAIYITSEAAWDETRLRHILAHELCHYRHGDHVWSALRGVCLALHWYNPLVWLAAALSRRDAELACDEDTIRSLGEDSRTEYGRTLIGLTCEKRNAMDLLCCATTMTDGKRDIKERIALIAKKPKMLRTTLLAALALALVATACTFTGAAGGKDDKNVTLYDCGGLSVAIPNEYMDQLVVMAEPEPEAAEQGLLISVYEKQSYEECRADYGENADAGFLFAIVRYTQAQYEQFLCSDGSGQSFFAKDDTCYYGWFVATDVQLYRSGMKSLDADSDEWKAWEALCEGCASVKDDFVARNHLTAYSDSEFFDKKFTYDSAHRYVTYYPYYTHQDTAAAQGFRWQDVAYTLILSQPATRGETGVWCVERWYDESGNLYPYFPDADGVAASEYYAGEQARCDAGQGESGLDPAQVALAFIGQYFGHTDVTLDCISIEDEPSAAEESVASADVNNDGREEAFYLDKTELDRSRLATLRAYDADGNEIWSEEAGAPHVGWDSLFLCKMDGKSYLLRYNPCMYQGCCTYTYTLFTLEGNAEHAVRSNSIEFDINGTAELDAPKMAAFANEINELLGESTLLLSSEGGNFSFGPASSEPFLERYAWLDETPELYGAGDSLETRLVKYSAWAVNNRARSDAAE